MRGFSVYYPREHYWKVFSNDERFLGTYEFDPEALMAYPQMDYKFDPAEFLRARVAIEFAMVSRTYFQRNQDGTCTIAIMVDNESDPNEPIITLSAKGPTMDQAYEILKPRLMLLAK